MADLTLNVGESSARAGGAQPDIRCVSAESTNVGVAEAVIMPDGSAQVTGVRPGQCDVAYEFGDGSLDSDFITVSQPVPETLEINVSPSRETMLIQWVSPPESDRVIGFRTRIKLTGATTWGQTVFLEPWTTAHLFSGLPAGVSHDVECSAINSDGEGNLQYGAAASDTATTLEFPDPPLAPVVTDSAVPGGFRLTWELAEGSDPATGAEIRWKREGTIEWREIPEFGAGTFTHDVIHEETRLGGTFDYQVRFLSPYGAGGWTTGQAVLASLTPGKPGTPTLTYVGNRARATWTAASGDVGQYGIQFSDQFPVGSSGILRPVSVSLLEFKYPARFVLEVPGTVRDIGLPGYYGNAAHRRNSVRIRAVNTAGAGPWSDPGAFPAPGIPAAAPVLRAQPQYALPTVLSVGSAGFRRNITWGAADRNHGAIYWSNAAPGEDLLLEVKLPTQAWSSAETITVSDPWFERISHLIENRMPSTGYDVRARSRNSAGTSGYSNVVRVFTAPSAATGVPGKPSTSWIAGGYRVEESNMPLLIWWMPGGQPSADRFELQWQEAPGTWTNLDPATAHQFTHEMGPRPQPGSQHRFQVRGVNSAGAGPWSDSVSFNDDMLASTPGSMTAVPSATGVRYSWTSNPFRPGDVYRQLAVWRENDDNGVYRTNNIPLNIAQRLTGFDAHSFPEAESYWYGMFFDLFGTRRGNPFSVMRRFSVPTRSLPGAPTVNVAPSRTTAVFTITPSRPQDDVRHYDIDVSTDRAILTGAPSSFAASLHTVQSPQTVGLPPAPLSPGTTYYYRVRAHNRIGDGAWATGQFSTTS